MTVEFSDWGKEPLKPGSEGTAGQLPDTPEPLSPVGRASMQGNAAPEQPTVTTQEGESDESTQIGTPTEAAPQTAPAKISPLPLPSATQGLSQAVSDSIRGVNYNVPRVTEFDPYSDQLPPATLGLSQRGIRSIRGKVE